MLVQFSTLMSVCVCGGGGDCSQGHNNFCQGHNFYKLKHRLLLFLFTNGFKLTLQEVSLKLFRTMSNLQSINKTNLR